MAEENYSVVKLDHQEYLRLAKIADSFVQNGKVEEKPNLVIITGGIASGKSTIRKQSYDNDYAFLDFGAIYLTLTENRKNQSEKDAVYCRIIGEMILTTAISQKRNIVIEIIGEKAEPLETIIKGMERIGYKPSIMHIAAEVTQAYERHIKQVNNGRDDISSDDTQEATMQTFIDYLNKN